MEQMDYNLAVSLIRGPRYRRCGLGPDGVHEEPRSVADNGHVPQDHGRHSGKLRGGSVAVRRWHAGEGLGLEALPAEGQRGAHPRSDARGCRAAVLGPARTIDHRGSHYNGAPHIAKDTQIFARQLGLKP